MLSYQFHGNNVDFEGIDLRRRVRLHAEDVEGAKDSKQAHILAFIEINSDVLGGQIWPFGTLQGSFGEACFDCSFCYCSLLAGLAFTDLARNESGAGCHQDRGIVP